MASGIDHYLEAERLIGEAQAARRAGHLSSPVDALALAHAMLSQAAATGCVGNEGERRAWLDVTSS